MRNPIESVKKKHSANYIFWIQKMTILITPILIKKVKLAKKRRNINSCLLFSTFSICLFNSSSLSCYLQWRTKELRTVWKSPSKQLLRRTLPLRTIFLLALGSSRRSPNPPSNVVAKKALILTHFAPNSTLFGVGGEGSLVVVISLERSQHFWPPLSENHFV